MATLQQVIQLVFEGVDIGRHAVVRRAIVDKGVRVPTGVSIGVDPVQDAARGLAISPAGITVVPKGFDFTAEPSFGSRAAVAAALS
jgi:glucose-1-phosphate adenylyltransferase